MPYPLARREISLTPQLFGDQIRKMVLIADIMDANLPPPRIPAPDSRYTKPCTMGSNGTLSARGMAAPIHIRTDRAQKEAVNPDISDLKHIGPSNAHCCVYCKML